jgi:tetratricopeptide (TPR) repeat protein
MKFLADALIKVEYFQFGSTARNARDYLDNICTDIGKCLLGDLSVQKIASIFKTILFGTEKFEFSLENSFERFTLCGTLSRKKGNCLGLTTLYISIANKLNIPLVPLLFENHIVPVYIKEGTPFFLETTKSGCVFDASSIGLYGEQRSFLSLDEFLAVHLANRSWFVYAPIGLMDDAIFLIDSALEIFPDYTAGWINRAAIMKKLDNTKEMQRSLDMAKALNPGIRYTRAIEQIENNNLTDNQKR